MEYRIESGAEYYSMDDTGRIWRPAVGMMAPSGQWRIVGAVERNNFGRVVRRYTLKEILTDPSAVRWQHKNGKQKTFLRDLDHGTLREWGSPRHRVFRYA